MSPTQSLKQRSQRIACRPLWRARSFRYCRTIYVGYIGWRVSARSSAYVMMQEREMQLWDRRRLTPRTRLELSNSFTEIEVYERMVLLLAL